MTEPTAGKADPLDAAIANINSKLEEKFKSNDEKFESFSQSLAREVRDIVTPKTEEKKKPSWMSDDSDDESYVTKADLKNTFREVLNDVNSNVTSVAKNIVTEHSNKTSIDVQALRDYPEVNTKEWLKEIESEMTAKVNSGISPDDKFLFSNAVSQVYARGVRQGRITPAHFAKKKIEADNASDDNFSLSGSSGGGRKNEGLNERSIAIAKKMGMSEERYRQIQEMKKKI